MALTIYHEALSEFIASVSEVKSYFQFVVIANQLRPWLGQMVDLGSLQQAQRSVLQSFMSQKDYTVEVGFSGLIISLASSFEQFVRRLIRDGIHWINKSVTRYEAMKVSLRHQNLLRSGHALETVIDPPAEVVYDYEILCRNLGTCRTNGGDLILNADAFTVRLTNMTEARINDALERIGITIDWDVFGRDQGIQRVTGQTRQRDATKETKARLKEFIKMRNRIAHSGVGGMVTQEIFRTFLPRSSGWTSSLLSPHLSLTFPRTEKMASRGSRGWQ